MALANHCNLLGRAPTASSLQIGNVDGPVSGVSTDNALVRWDGTTGRLIQNGVVTEADFTGALTGPTDQSTTTAVGLAFTNQPANDGIEVLSSNAGDTTQTVTIIGTTNGTDTVVVETVTLNGTTAVPTVKTDWGVVLAVKKSAVTLGTVTVREASADQTITAGLTAAVLSVGVTTVTNTAAYNQLVSMVADAATTKQFGFQGTNSAGTVIYDSQALTGTTAAVTNSTFLTITELYRGDLEAARTVTVTTNGGWTLTGGGGGIISFDTLTGGLTLTPSGTGGILSGVAGTMTNPAFSRSGDVDTGLYFPAANQMGITVGGGRRAQFDSSGFNVYSSANQLAATIDGTAAGGALTISNKVLLGGLTTDGVGVLQFPAGTTSAGGITFGPDVNLYRTAADQLGLAGASTIRFGLFPGGSLRGYWLQNGTTGTLSSSAGNLVLASNDTTALTLDSSQNATLAKLITSYNGIATAGNGIVTVQGAGRSTAQTAAVASVAAYTVGAADASFIVSANVLVTTSTAHTFTTTVAYTDDGNTSRTLTLNFSQLTGAFITAITNVTGAGPYEGVPVHIRCKASTAITVATTGTFTTVTYNAEAAISKLA